MNMWREQRKHDDQKNDLCAKQEAVKRSTSEVPTHTTPPATKVNSSTPAAGESVAPSQLLILDASNSPAPEM